MNIVHSYNKYLINKEYKNKNHVYIILMDYERKPLNMHLQYQCTFFEQLHLAKQNRILTPFQKLSKYSNSFNEILKNIFKKK